MWEAIHVERPSGSKGDCSETQSKQNPLLYRHWVKEGNWEKDDMKI